MDHKQLEAIVFSRDAQCVRRHVAWYGHDMCLYNMAQYEHVLVGHTARHSMARTWTVADLEF